MSFGRRASEPYDDATPDGASESTWHAPLVAGLAIFALGVVFIVFWSGEGEHTAFERAAAQLGVTDASRAELRERARSELTKLQSEICDESFRDRAGAAVVAYYETLLERPLVQAGLEMSYETRCQKKTDSNAHPLQALLARRGLGVRLALPWDCQPSHWRTPLDRAVQSRIEQLIAAGLLTSDSLSGTLALIARPMHVSPLRKSCRRPTDNSTRRRLPLIASPPDEDTRSRWRR